MTSSAAPKANLPMARLLLAVTGLLTLALGASAFHTVFTLRELRRQYLDNQATEIAQSLSRAVRGPGRFANLSSWRSTFDETLEHHSGNLVYLGLEDAQGRLLVEAGTAAAGASVSSAAASGLWIHRQELSAGRRGGPRWADSGGPAGSVLVVALDPASAEFIARQAWVHAAVSGSAILVLWTLSLYLLHANRRLFESRMREESERHLADLGRMSATLAHEIRNPLGAMKGLSQVIREELPPDHRAHPLIETVVGEAGRLEKLVTDLLAFSRPRSPQLSPIDLAVVVREAAELAARDASTRDISIQTRLPNGPLATRSDGDGLRQVLLNGLRNACEASPPGGTVEVSAGLDRARARFWIEIRDQGPGLGDVDPEEYFQPFRTTKLQAGTGLGLAVSRRVVNSLGGAVSLSNHPQGGALLRVELPALN